MSEWISVTNHLPGAWQVVWIYWRDREVLLGCRICEGDDPSEQWYSFDDEKCRWCKWWVPVNSSNYDKPKPPQ